MNHIATIYWQKITREHASCMDYKQVSFQMNTLVVASEDDSIAQPQNKNY